jgi:hypothetical protein
MAEKLKYCGKTVFLETSLRMGGWHWAYAIEGGDLFSNPNTPLPSREMALKEAGNAACQAIDLQRGASATEVVIAATNSDRAAPRGQ